MKAKKENRFIQLYRKGKAAYNGLTAKRFTTLAGTLVFFLIMSLVPFVFWLTLLFGQTDVRLVEIELFGWTEGFLSTIQDSARQATAGVSVLFLVTTLWSSTGFFYHLRRSGEIVYEHRRTQHGWKIRLSAAVITFAVLLFFAVAGTLFVGVNYFIRGYSPILTYPVRYSLLLVLCFFAAWILNGYVCPYRCSPADTVMGSLFTAIAWLVASVAFTVYLSLSDPGRLYGALSVVIVFLLWLYWLMICFTAGVVWNCRRVQRRNPQNKTF